MTLKYSVAEMRNLLNPEEPPQFYARSQVREFVDEDKLARSISFSTSLTEGDVRNVVRNLTYEIGRRLSEGDMVSLGTLGTFQFEVKSRGAQTRAEFNHHNIKKVRFRFRPGSLLKENMANLKFEEVLPRKVQKDAMRELKNG